MSHRCDIGVIGLAVMGRNLVLNLTDKGYRVAVWNYERDWVEDFVNGDGKGRPIRGTLELEEFVSALQTPRRILIMIRAGSPVDQMIEQLLPLLEPGDILMDGGNSNYQDTIRRTSQVESQGQLYIGTGVSGGEEGARHGPALMPGGSPEAWPQVKELLQAIAARLEDGTPCCDWMGEDGAGHFVKMVHNGIEYGDMQLIAEAYHLMSESLRMGLDEMSATFGRWNEGRLRSYLIEITRDILAYRDENGEAVVEKILDSAGQKGTGKWTVVTALEQGVPLTLIGEAVFARFLSSIEQERVEASRVLRGPRGEYPGEPADFLNDLHDALYASKIVSYAQGYQLLRSAAGEYGWNLNYGGIATVWSGGCIIRSVFLSDVRKAFERFPELTNLLVDDFFREELEKSQSAWRRVVAGAVEMGIPVPAMSSALAYFDSYRRELLPANLIQAQRDYFGAHTYERVDRPRGERFHTNWTGRGGQTTAGSYEA